MDMLERGDLCKLIDQLVHSERAKQAPKVI